MATKPFVKAEATTVDPAKSRMEIEQMLRRYGATGYSFSFNTETAEARVEFVVPDSKAKNAPKIPVRIPINAWDVFDAMYGRPTIQRPGTGKYSDQHRTQWIPQAYDPAPRPYENVNPKHFAQAERVAWRNLVLWIDAALSAATIGLRTIAQTFAGDRLVTDEAGNTMRVQDLLEQAGGALPRGGRLLLLTPPTP